MREIVVFGSVGLAATLTHYLAAIVAIEAFGIAVLAANLIAYCIAVSISFLGHSILTFRATMTQSRLIKFIIVSLSALVVSQFILWFLTVIDLLGHRFNMLVVVGVVPCYSYLLSRFWVYQFKN